jgi:hypothetical protein
MTLFQQQAVRCALVDLIGSLREWQQGDARQRVRPQTFYGERAWQHDWRGHLQTIEDLAAVFPSLGGEFNNEIDTLSKEMCDATD